MPLKKPALFAFGGVDSRSNPANYPPDRLLRCKNWTPRPSGQLQLRYGFTKPTQGAQANAPIHSAAYYEQYAGPQFVIYGQGTTLKQVAEGTGTITPITTLVSGNPWGHFRSANRLFMGNGTDFNSWDGTTLRAVGIRVPSTTEAAAVNVTANTASGGTFSTTLLSGYQLYMVYFNPVTGAVGNRVAIGNRIQVTAAGTALVLTGLPNLAGVNAEWVKGIGRTNDNGQVPYWFIDGNGNRIVANNSASVATLTSSVVDFTQELPYRNGVPPSALNKFAKVGSKIFGAADGDINLHYTEDDTDISNGNFVGIPAESWSPDNIEPFPTAEVPTSVQSYDNEGWFYSKNYFAIWSLTSFQQGQNPWRKTINVGCAGQRAWIDTPYGPHWVTMDKQLVSSDGSTVWPVSEEYEAALLQKIGDAFMGKTECAYYRNSDLGIDRIYVKALDANGNPLLIIHDFRLRDFRNQIAQGYESLYVGMVPNTLIGSGYTPRQNVRDTNGRERLWTGAVDGNFYQLEDGNSDNGQNYTGDAIALINAGDQDGKAIIDAIEWQGDGQVQVSFSSKSSLNLADFEQSDTEAVEVDNPDNRYQVKVVKEARWVYARFQLTSHPADGNFVISDPPFVPMPVYGTINAITPKFGVGRRQAP
jgi:hypothetical protein